MKVIRFLIFLLLCGTLHGHVVMEAQLSLEVHGDKVTGIAEADPSDVLSEFRILESVGPRDLAWLRSLGPKDWLEIEREIGRHWHDRLTLLADDVPVPWTLKIEDFHQATPKFIREGAPEDQADFVATIEATLPSGARKVEVAWKEPLSMVLMLTIGTGDQARLEPLLSDGRALVAERSSAAEPELRVVATPSLGKWVLVGFEHILPKGVDHILFVLGLFLFVPKWKPLLQQTLVFTLAHSLSLAAASLGWVNLPSTPVEIMIAVSIAWIGVENLLVKSFHKWRLVLVGVFGLIHGLGFAGVLAELLPADQPDKLPAALFGFNVGVEFGQVTVLALAFLAIGIMALVLCLFRWAAKRPSGESLTESWRASRDRWEDRYVWVKRGGSIIVALAGLILVAERITGIDIVAFL